MTLAREAIRLNTTVYGDQTTDPVSGLMESMAPESSRTIITHETPLSTVWPQKDLGPIPATLVGEILLYETSVHAFISDVANATAERKLYWVDSGVEVYAYVRSGTAQRKIFAEGYSSRWQLVTFTFIATRTPVYRASDDVIMWGGS